MFCSVSFILQGQIQQNAIKERVEYLISVKDYQKAKSELNQYYSNHNELLTDSSTEYNLELGNLELRLNIYLENEEKEFIRIKNSKTIASCDEYLMEFPFGKYRDDVIKLKAEYSDDADQRAYLNAKANPSQESFKAYLNKFPSGRYKMEITKLLSEQIETDVYQNAKKEQTIAAYENYITKYPNGKYSETVNKILGDAYLDYGEKDYRKRSYDSAIEQFKNYLKRFPNGPDAEIAKANIKKAEQQQKKLGADLLGFYSDKNTPFGVYFGAVNRRSLSYYANFSFNVDFLELTKVDNTINNLGISTNTSGFPKAVEPPKIKNGNFSFSNGIAFPIFYPFWGYVGGGLSYLPYMQQYDVFASNGVLIDTKYIRNTDRTELLWYPEAGIKLKVAKLVILRYGVRYYQNQPLLHQFGLGIQLEQ